jgi:tetratricopeptide (TPR) repeat protein
MSELYDFSKNIQAFISEKKFAEALQYYKNHNEQFSKDEIAGNEYIVANIIRCLRKVNKLKEAKRYIDFLKIEINDRTSKRILESYGWVLYDLLKVNFNDQVHNDDEDVITGLIDENYEGSNQIFIDNDPFQNEIKTFLPLLDINSKYSPFSKLLSATLKKEKKKPKPNWQFVNELLDGIDVNQLNTNCESFNAKVKGQEKTIEMASDKEAWYAYKTKALLKLGKFQECNELSQKALDSFEKFHYSNNVWFARRIALCKKELGDIDVAIAELLTILKKKRDWFIQAELCDLYFTKKKYSEALKYGVLAANNFGDTEYKIGLFLRMGNIFDAMENYEKAYEHYLLVKLIREEQNWKISQTLKDLLSAAKKEYKNEFKDFSSLLKHLQTYWKSLLPDELKIASTNQKNLLGEISNINPEKGFGFIKGFDKYDYYFKINQLRSDVKVFSKGVKVIFDPLPPKEEGKKPSAINIRLKG